MFHSAGSSLSNISFSDFISFLLCVHFVKYQLIKPICASHLGALCSKDVEKPCSRAHIGLHASIWELEDISTQGATTLMTNETHQKMNKIGFIKMSKLYVSSRVSFCWLFCWFIGKRGKFCVIFLPYVLICALRYLPVLGLVVHSLRVDDFALCVNWASLDVLLCSWSSQPVYSFPLFFVVGPCRSVHPPCFMCLKQHWICEFHKQGKTSAITPL